MLDLRSRALGFGTQCVGSWVLSCTPLSELDYGYGLVADSTVRTTWETLSPAVAGPSQRPETQKVRTRFRQDIIQPRDGPSPFRQNSYIVPGTKSCKVV